MDSSILLKNKCKHKKNCADILGKVKGEKNMDEDKRIEDAMHKAQDAF